MRRRRWCVVVRGVWRPRNSQRAADKARGVLEHGDSGMKIAAGLPPVPGTKPWYQEGLA